MVVKQQKCIAGYNTPCSFFIILWLFASIFPARHLTKPAGSTYYEYQQLHNPCNPAHFGARLGGERPKSGISQWNRFAGAGRVKFFLYGFTEAVSPFANVCNPPADGPPGSLKGKSHGYQKH